MGQHQIFIMAAMVFSLAVLCSPSNARAADTPLFNSSATQTLQKRSGPLMGDRLAAISKNQQSQVQSSHGSILSNISSKMKSLPGFGKMGGGLSGLGGLGGAIGGAAGGMSSVSKMAGSAGGATSSGGSAISGLQSGGGSGSSLGSANSLMGAAKSTGTAASGASSTVSQGTTAL